MKHWYAVHTKSRKERVVAQLLESRTVEHYLPWLDANGEMRSTGGAPFYPGYLFARLDVQAQGVAVLQWLPGAVGVVQVDHQPVPVPEAVIEGLRERIEEINALGSMRSVSFRRGDRVVIVRGLFAGYEGVFDLRLNAAQRVRILVQLITSQRAIPVELHASDLKRLPA